MLEALLIVAILVLLQWSSPWSYVVAGLLMIICLPGVLVMRGAAPFVTTPKKIVRSMLALADIQKGDRAYDLGCGDGRLVFGAAACGAHATGYELSLPAYMIAKTRSFSHQRATIRYGNLWCQSYSDADVVFCYFLTDTMQDFERKIWPTLKPGCRVVSHAFAMKHVPEVKRDGGAVMYVKG